MLFLIVLIIWIICSFVASYIFGKYDPEPWFGSDSPGGATVALLGPFGIMIALYYKGYDKNANKKV